MKKIAPAFALAAILIAGSAHAGSSEDVIFHSNLNQYGTYNDIWGYTAPDGGEYALLGTTVGVSVVRVTDPANPVETGFFPGPISTWRDIKTFENYAYVVNETSGGLDVIDLSDPDQPTLAATGAGGFVSAHNLYIDEPNGVMYIAGANNQFGGIRFLNLNNPVAPATITQWNDEYAHDVYAKDNIVYVSAIDTPRLTILDVTNFFNVQVLGSISGYPAAFTHNAWPTDDGQYVMTTDETSASSVRMWDISNLGAITQTDVYKPTPSTIPHNAHIEGNYAYISYYTLGVKILDISDPTDLVEVGSYDTYPANDASSFDGCWGVFPYFGNTTGLLVASDVNTGLYVLEFRGVTGNVQGAVSEAGAPLKKIVGATVEVAQTGASTVTDENGEYLLADSIGEVDVQVSAFGYQPKVTQVTIMEGVTSTLDVDLDPVAGGALVGIVRDAVTGVPLSGANVRVLSTPLETTTDASGNYSYGNIPLGSYELVVTQFGYSKASVPITISVAGATIDVPLTPALEANDFEASFAGWTVNTTATTGGWEVADPEGTFDGTVAIQPEDDHTPSGTQCWVTQAAAGSIPGSFDIDAGVTQLTSPTYNLFGAASAEVSYWRWYSTGTGIGSTDDWVAEVSADGGSNWVVLERLGTAENFWTNKTFTIESFVPLTSQIVFRFTAQDTLTGSITEAALDDFSVYAVVDPVTSAPILPLGLSELSLGRVAPNPSRSTSGTTLELTLPARSRVEAAIYDVAGRRVATVFRGALEPGGHRLNWTGQRDDGRFASSGVYFVNVTSDLGRDSKKLVVIR